MKRLALFLVALLAFTALNVFPVLGQEQAIILKSDTVQNQFPDGVVFEAAAETTAPAKIQEIKLEMKVSGSSRSSYTYLKFTPDTVVQGQYLLRASGAQYKPPGTLIEYRFIITDSQGRILETPQKTFLYLDNRFEWEKVSQGKVEVYYYYPPTRSRAEVILQASTDTVTKMGALLGIKSTRPIRIIAYNNATHMAAALPFQSAATQRELLIQGQAWYDYGILLMLAGDTRADGVASHEVTHMVVQEAAQDVFVNLPSWLNEGLAEYGNLNPGYSYDEVLNEAIRAKKLLFLRHMQAQPGTSQEILLFYGQARSVVKYLIETYGQDKISELFAAFKQKLPIDEALRKVYGFDQDGLDNAWRKSRGLPPVEPSSAVSPVPSPTKPSSSGVTEEPKPAAKSKRPGFGCARP